MISATTVGVLVVTHVLVFILGWLFGVAETEESDDITNRVMSKKFDN